MKRTKIVCTIGPASESPVILKQMMRAGLDVCRLNFSHGSYKNHSLLIKNIRTTAKSLNKPVAILQDLQGPKIRIGDVPEAGIVIKKGQTVFLVPENFKLPKNSTGIYVPLQYGNLYKDVKKGHRVFIEDGKIHLKITNVKDQVITCKAEVSETIKSHKGMNFPDSEISVAAITDKDEEDLAFGIEQDVDFIALSFVKDASDIKKLRQMITKLEASKAPDKRGTKIIAKIERREAVANFENILNEADGIMIARGDLGMEIPFEDLIMVQKKIIRRCKQANKPVIVATQMLDSMTNYPVPTRAEISDVANAILDGTDAVMLSGESATGKYPVKTVQVMHKIAEQAEITEVIEHERIGDELKSFGNVIESVAFAAQEIAEDVGADLILVPTISGFTARAVVKYKSIIPVAGVATTEKGRNQLCLSWGVDPYIMANPKTVNELLVNLKQLAVANKLVKKGDRVVIVAGDQVGVTGQSNLIKIETI